MRTIVSIAFVFYSCVLWSQDLEEIGNNKPFSLSSSINVSTQFYKPNRNINRQAPFTYNIYGAPVITVYGISFPLSFRLSNHHRSFQQPLNQFGLSPEYKWIRVHAGYRNIHFSPFTLSGRRILGAGIELNPGKFRFGLVAGKTQQQRLPQDVTEPDSSFFTNQTRPSFSEKLYAVKLGWGSEKNFIDFYYLKGKDEYSNELDENPIDNTAFGMSYRINFKDKISWETDIGLSAQNRNSIAPRVDLNEIPAGPFVDKIFTPTQSSQYLLAVQSELGYKSRSFSIALSGRRIDPDYRTVGMNYQMTDILEYKLKFSSRMFKNHLLLSGSAGKQTNNLHEFRSKTSERLIYNLIVNYMPSQSFGVYGSFTNFGISQAPMQRSLSDTTLLEQINKTLILTPHLSWSTGEMRHTCRLNLSYFDLTDRSLYLINRSDLQTSMAQLQYSGRNRDIPWAFQGGVTLQNQKVTGHHGSRFGGFAGVDYRPPSQKLNAGARITYHQNKVNGVDDGNTWRLTLSASSRITKSIRFNLRYHYLSNASASELIDQTFTESILTTSLQLNF